MASAAEVLRAASAIIEAGWSTGAVARDASGFQTSLHAGGDPRAGINPAAVSFSVYGAICKATYEAGHLTRPELVWDVLYRLAQTVDDTPRGGTNYVHPLLQFNEALGRTKEDVMALLELAAQDCDAIGQGTFPPPVQADLSLVEAL